MLKQWKAHLFSQKYLLSKYIFVQKRKCIGKTKLF